MIPFIGLRARLLSGAAALSLVAAAPAVAADLAAQPVFAKPAVDAVNGKIEGFGGWADGRLGRSGDFSGGALGSVTVPLGDRFGFQADGLAASHDGDFAGGGAGHLFTRDPDRYLFGLYGSAVGFDDRAGAWNGKIGVEAEAYLGRFTIAGVAGYERTRGGANGVETIRRGGRFFDYVDLGYYATDDLKLSIGHRYTGDRHAAAFGAEYRLPVDAVDLSLFAEGRVGEKDYNAAWGGLKVYFGGGSKPLIARHRESDPAAWLKDDLFSVTSRRTPGAVSAPPPPPPPPGSGPGSGPQT